MLPQVVSVMQELFDTKMLLIEMFVDHTCLKWLAALLRNDLARDLVPIRAWLVIFSLN